MSKKISLIIISIFMFNLTFWVSFSNEYEAQTMSKKTWYDLYKERVELFCSEYKFDTNNTETIYLMDDTNSFPDLSTNWWIIAWYQSWRDLEFARNIYRKNMDWIYECATSIVHNRTLRLLHNLVSWNSQLNARLSNKLSSKITQIEQIQRQRDWSEKNKCKLNDDKDNSIIKRSVLRQTTYELCRYNFYLEYLKEFNQNIEQIYAMEQEIMNTNPNYESYFNNQENSIAIERVFQLEKQKIAQINNEINNTYRVFPLAYRAFSEYENNIMMHIMLELIREEYAVLRESLHKTLNPINQVVYKISNAMRR